MSELRGRTFQKGVFLLLRRLLLQNQDGPGAACVTGKAFSYSNVFFYLLYKNCGIKLSRLTDARIFEMFRCFPDVLNCLCEFFFVYIVQQDPCDAVDYCFSVAALIGSDDRF